MVDSTRNTKVIIVADYDRDEILNDKIIDYCSANDYELVWMNLDVEDVYLGKQIPNNRKNSEAINFQSRKHILLPRLRGLATIEPLKARHTTNILLVLDKYIERS